jgi:hypothetical protein
MASFLMGLKGRTVLHTVINIGNCLFSINGIGWKVCRNTPLSQKQFIVNITLYYFTDLMDGEWIKDLKAPGG